MEIRTLSPGELALRLSLCNFRDPEQMIRENEERINRGTADIFGLFEDGALIGELSVKYESDDPLQTIPGRRAYLYAFRVRQDRQGRGLGTVLLRRVMELMEARGIRELTIGVEDDNTGAFRMYRREGFSEVIDRREESYQGDSYTYNLLLRRG